VAWLFIAFIVVPVVEIWLITQVASQLGWFETIFLVIAVSAAGAWLVRREGLGVIRRIQDSFRGAKLPTDDLADGAMIFFASALMLTPGFLTDFVGLALLIPPIRAILRPPLIRAFRKRVEVRTAGLGTSFGAGAGTGFTGFGRRGPAAGRDVYDVSGSAASADADLTDITEEPDELPPS
jgi:UPF0716 protein FxsA